MHFDFRDANNPAARHPFFVRFLTNCVDPHRQHLKLPCASIWMRRMGEAP